MTRALRGLFVLAVLAQTLLAQVPTVDQVLQRYVSALGGQNAIEKIHTMAFRGTIELPELKASGTTAEYFKEPDHFAAVTEIAGHGTTKFVCDGHECWQQDPRNGVAQVTGDDLADMQRRANIHWDLKLHEFYPDLQVKGREVVNGEDAWKLEASLGKSTFDFFFSVKTGLLIRFDTDQHVPNGTSSVSISDYRPVDKVLFAFGAAQTAGSVKWSRQLKEVKFNEPIDETVFLKPGKTGSN